MNEKKIERGFAWAKTASYDSTFKQHHLGAAIVYKGNLLAIGHNSYKTSPVQREYNKLRNFDVDNWTNSLHAEIHALNKVKNLDIDFSKVNLYIYRQWKSGKSALARPCPACMRMIKDMGIKNIYYTTEYGYCYEKIKD